MVSPTLLGLPKSWHNYQDFASGREKLLDWELLWSYLVQEEFRWNTRDETYSKEVEEEFALANKAKKAKGNKSQHKVGDRLVKIQVFSLSRAWALCHEFPTEESKQEGANNSRSR